MSEEIGVVPDISVSACDLCMTMCHYFGMNVITVCADEFK